MKLHVYVSVTLLLAFVSCDFPLDEASAQRSRVGRYKEYVTDDPTFDVVTYYYDGARGKPRADVVATGVKTIRKGGFKHQKRMTLVVFCNLTTTDKSHKLVYPFGLFLESETLKHCSVPVPEMVDKNLVESPMNWDYRINNWVYTTNNLCKSGPDISENADYTPSTNVLERGWFLDLRALTNKAQVYAIYGLPKYFITDGRGYSEVYPVVDPFRSQSGTVRVWYDGETVTETGCHMVNQ